MKTTIPGLPLFFILALAPCLQGCASKTPNQNNENRGNVMANAQPSIDTSNVLRVKVDRAGKIFLDGKQVSLDELKKAFARLKQENGVVWYYRENPEDEPTAEAMSVIQAIIDAGLPVRLSSKPDYSDAIDAEGKSNPAH